MFKNAKLLKGLTIALSCALVLSLGIAFGIYYVGAAANTVTLYVSEYGDNTTGKDEASAYTSIMDATKAANDMALKPGTEVKIYLVERVRLTTKDLNSQVLDTAGNVVPVTLEGYGYDGNKGNFPVVYCQYIDTSNTNSYRQWMLLGGDITVRNVKFLSELQDTFNTSSSSTAISNRVCVRYFYANGHQATFDNVRFETEAPDKIKWSLRADAYASASVKVTKAATSGYTLKNGDYSNCDISISNYPTNNYDLKVDFENATLPTVKILASTNYTTTGSVAQKANSVAVTFGAGTVVKENSDGNSVIFNAKGYNQIPGGVTVNYMEGSEFQGVVTTTSKISTVFPANVTNNFYGGNFKDAVYAGPNGIVEGTLTNNIYGGTFTTFRATAALDSGHQQNGTVTNNISGGNFKTAFHGTGHMANHNAIINNITGGTFKAFYGVSYASGATSVTNNISGGTFSSTFHGAGAGGRDRIPEVVTNNITGGTFKGTTYLGQSNVDYSGSGVGKIVNNIEGAAFSGTVYCGGGGLLDEDSITDSNKKKVKLVLNPETGIYERNEEATDGFVYLVKHTARRVTVGDITNNIKNCSFTGAFFGGFKVGLGGNITNNISDCTFGSTYNGGCGEAYTQYIYTAVEGAEAYTAYTREDIRHEPAVGNIVNNLTNIIVSGSGRSFMGSATGKSGDITNTIKDSNFASTGTFNFYGGPQRGVAGDVYNELVNCTFAKTISMGGGYTDGAEHLAHVDNIENHLTGCTFTDGFRAGVLIGDTTGDIVTYVYDGNTFNKAPAFSNGGGAVGGNVEIYLLGDSTYWAGVTCGGANYKSVPSTAAKTTVLVKDGKFGGVFRAGSGSTAGVDGVFETTICGGVFEDDILGAGAGTYGAASLTIDPSGSAAKLQLSTNVSNAKENVFVTIKGGDKPIIIGNETYIYADALAGTKNIVFSQSAEWKSGLYYVTLPAGTDMSLIRGVNQTDSVAGSAILKQASTGREVLSGTSGTPVVSTPVQLKAYTFNPANKLEVIFYVPTEDIEKYMTAVGSWEYGVLMNNEVLVSGRLEGTIPAESVKSITIGGVSVECFYFATDLGISATDYDQKLIVSLAGNESAAEMTVYGLLEGGIPSAKPEVADLLKALHNYGTEASNVFEGQKNELKYADITYTGTYNDKPSSTSSEDGFKFYATSLSLEEEVSLNFYLNLADGVTADQMAFVVKNKAGATVDASKVSVKAVSGQSEYDVIVSVKLSIREMADTYTVTASLADGTAVATCTNSIASACAAYIAEGSKFAPVSKALLAYIEKAIAAL